MFVLLFAFVFGGAIPLPGYGDPNAYREYLMPGIFAQTIAFAAATTAVGMADDIEQGHHRPLPVAADGALGGARPAGRSPTSSTTAGILIVLMLSGLVVGWRVNTGIPSFLAGVGLLLLFAFAMSWIGVWLGLSVPTVEVAQQVAFIVIFPLTFISNAFVPSQRCRTSSSRSPSGTRSARSPRRARAVRATRTLPVKAGSFPSEHPILHVADLDRRSSSRSSRRSASVAIGR